MPCVTSDRFFYNGLPLAMFSREFVPCEKTKGNVIPVLIPTTIMSLEGVMPK